MMAAMSNAQAAPSSVEWVPRFKMRPFQMTRAVQTPFERLDTPLNLNSMRPSLSATLVNLGMGLFARAFGRSQTLKVHLHT